jgi:TolB-like protein/tRNA A-37 threonylcarbamoyl transferase component Bud32/Flp pilus assembly protein TadD
MTCPKCGRDNNDDSRYCSQCGTSLFSGAQGSSYRGMEAQQDSALDLPVGSIFAERYRVIEELGSGGMGRVYKAYDDEIDENVSLKLIKREITADRDTIDRFQNELKLARRISHKNVCRLYHFSRNNGTYYITMEYVQGEDLKRMIRMTKHLNPAAAVEIAQQICAGLEEAHRLGIVHRDLKTSNIMIDREGHARIMDFGLARSLREKGKTGVGAILGTPEYMSPEQVEARQVDQRSDLYSLGIILYEMVTGKVPFRGDTPLHTAVKHKTEIPTSPSRINTRVPEELSRVILKCLEKESYRRYQDAREVRKDLAVVAGALTDAGLSSSEDMAGGGGGGPGQGAATKAARRAQRGIVWRAKSHGKKRWLLVAALVVAAVAVRIYLFNLDKNNGALPPASPDRIKLVVLPFENLGPAEDEYFADGLTEEITGRLQYLHGLRVISRTSAQHYKGTLKSTRQISQELGVDYVLEGTVRWERESEGPGRVRITPRLIRVSDDTHIWSEMYEKVFGNVLHLQTEIAEEVIRQLDLTMLEPERAALTAKGTENAEAYDCFLQANVCLRDGWNLRDREAYLQAVELLERAVKLDEEYVSAHINLAQAHQMLYFVGIDRTDARLDLARASMERAEAIAPDLPEVKIGWAFFHYRALRDYERSLTLYHEVRQALPNFTTPIVGYILRRQGRWEESLAELEEVFRRDPRDPDLPSQIGVSLVCMRRFEDAERWFRIAEDIREDYLPPKFGRAELPLLASGDIEGTQANIDTIAAQGQGHPYVEYMEYYLALLRRDYNRALEALQSAEGDAFYGFNYYLHKNLAYAELYHYLEQHELKRFHAEAARIALERAVEATPNDARVRSALGLAYAYLGRAEEALQEAQRAVEIEPVSLDAASGPSHVLNLALVYTVVGEYDKALEQLEYLMSIPAGNIVTDALLELEPCWAPLDWGRAKLSILK